MKLFTKTFGCQMNFADSDEMGRHFRERGFARAEELESADAVLVNTCTVRDLAEHKAMSYLGRLKDWKEEAPERVIIVTGCAAERAKADMKRRFPHIDLIVGAKDIEKFPGELDAFFQAGSNEERLVPSALGNLEATGVVQYVTVMRGCNYNCTYCIVPSVRGREIYRPAEEILAETRARVASGAKEIWFLGQTVNSYRPAAPPRPGYDFADLLRDANEISGLERLRFISPHPFYLTPQLISAMADCKTVCEHIHLPVQSGSNKMLQRMKRNYSRESYLAGLRSLRAAIPNISVTTDIIVGFPGETHEDYLETLSLVKEAGFDSAYGFKYSPRPGTPAAAWNDDVPREVKEERVTELLSVTDALGVARAAGMVGSVQEMLVEEKRESGMVRGKTRGAWRVRIPNSSLEPGMVLPVRITSTHSRELHGEPALDGKRLATA